ncbi:unannotated protein [freshwater metagenome]|uniref:Unannotated protein n=1 Tax=freshwater metagenome TaxID=449393 RepID=A0A6J6L356_9ZZZZ
MDELLPPENDPRRQQVRQWIAEHPAPTHKELAESGYVAPHWPAPYGLGADPVHQLIIDDELARAGIARPSNQIGIGWAAPTIIYAGTQEQKDRYVMPALSAEEIWCQLFSEPGAGSDLASLSTRAVRDGDEWVINGQKVWTTGAHYSKFGILIARTNPDAPKHKGITYFICPMDSPGIEIRTIRNIAGAESFNEVFFTDVRLPHDCVVGQVDEGWRLAKVTLGNERVSLSTGGVLWGNGPTALDVVAEAQKLGVSDSVMRQRIAKIYIEHVVLEIIRMRTLTARMRGTQPGPEASIRKIMADEHGQKVMEVARDVIGADAMLIGLDDAIGGKNIRSKSWYSGYMFSRALTIGGGTGEVQRNILGERVLGLPSEPDPTKGLTWSQSQR